MTPTAPAPQVLPRRDFLRRAGLATASAALAPTAFPAFGQEPSPTVIVALVGCAHIHTPSYVSLLKHRKDVKVKYVWDHDHARAEKSATELGSRVLDQPETIWSDPEVKAVVICSETNRHRDLILAAAQAGKHMFAEKPLGFTAVDSQAMAAAIEQAHLLFTTGYFMRAEPANLFLREQVGNGAFGKITRVRGSTCHNGSLGHWFDTDWRWMTDPKQAGVGAFGDLGTHALDILMWLFGDVQAVTADIKVVAGNYGDCDESGEALLKFKNGITGTLAAGWVDVDNPIPLLISGTEGHAFLNNRDLYFKSKHVPGADGSSPWTELPAKLPLPLAQFIDAVAGKPGGALVTPREAAARVSVMEAAYKAARARAWVEPA